MGLDPDVNHGAWTDAESEILLARREQIGAKWAEVASGLPGRTNNSCKNQWGSDNVISWSGSRQVDEVCVCDATNALRKPRFSTNHSGHKRASGSRLHARSARAGSDSRAVARRAATFW